MPEKRQLAAIMFTDIVGYTALMGKDENAAYQLLKRNRGVQKPLIEKHGGKWLKEMGDGVLASFQSASSAVNCALEIQKVCRDEPELILRIGIHQGDVIVDEGDVFGDGVNIASRIEPLAPAGGIYISESIYRNIQNKKTILASFAREENLKNVDHPVRIYEVNVDASEIIESGSRQDTRINAKPPAWRKPVALVFIIALLSVIGYFIIFPVENNTTTGEVVEIRERDKSIAVLPFTNMSGDPEQEYFSDGMMEEILNYLFQIGDLQVTSRTSVMQYKGTTKTIPQIAGELGVSTILEGSVRKSGNKVRITVQLIDGITDKHLWSETFDRNLDDVFRIQSEVAKTIASTLKAEIQPEVQLRIESQPTNNLDAYNLLLETRKLSILNPDQNKKAIDLIEQAIKLDPDYSMAHFSLGFRLQSGATWQASEGGMDPQKARLLSRPYFEKAIELDPDNGIAHQFLAHSKLWFDWDFEGAEKEYQETKRIFPNYTWTEYLIAQGKYEEALIGAKNYIEINPTETYAWVFLIKAYYYTGFYREAVNYIKKGLMDSTMRSYDAILFPIAEVYMYMEKYAEAMEVINIIKSRLPDSDTPRALAVEAISSLKLEDPANTDRLIDKLKKHSEQNAGGSPSFYLSAIYAQKGELDTSFEWLEKSYRDHEVEMYWLKVEPPFEPLRADPRYQEMLDKVGFPK